MRKLMLAGALIGSLGFAAVAGTAGAQPNYYQHHHYYHHYYRHAYYRHSSDGCRYARHRAGAIGAVAGAVGGGIIGSAITHGGAGGTLLGAGAGALTGNAIARNSHHC